MLTLTGIVRSRATLGGGKNKKTGEVVPLRDVLQVETVDNRGLVEMRTITVPDLATFPEKVGEQISLPVRAWTATGAVNLAYEEKQ